MMNLPNRVTLCRLFVVPFVVISIVYYKPELTWLKPVALVLFLAASLTDALDGYIARTQNLKSRLGTFLDPFVDKALLISVFISLQFSTSFKYHMPMWALILIVFRDIIIVSVLVIYFTTAGKVIREPNLLGKATTVLQIVTIATFLLEWGVCQYLWPVMVLVTLISGSSYLFREWRKSNGVEAVH
jgi:cardiolipin synthase